MSQKLSSVRLREEMFVPDLGTISLNKILQVGAVGTKVTDLTLEDGYIKVWYSNGKGRKGEAGVPLTEVLHFQFAAATVIPFKVVDKGPLDKV